MLGSEAIPERVFFTNGEYIDRYLVIKELGSGSFGDVYLVSGRQPNEKFAVKILKLWTTDKKTRDNLSKRFELEFQTGQIKSNYLVPSLDYGYVKGNPFIVMEYCPGGSLRDKLGDHMDFDVITQYATEILKGLQALHNNGKTHRDLKPDNVLFDENGRAKLTDFGITGHANIKIKLTETDWLGKPKDPMGTWLYMPSEQINPRNRKETILPTIDIFAFGVVCYEMLTGFYPFGALTKDNLDRDLARLTKRVVRGEWDSPAMYGVNAPPIWIEILDKCFEPDYRKRYQSADVILQILGARFTPLSKRPMVSGASIGLQVMQGEEYGKLYNLSEILGRRAQGLLKLGRMDPSGEYRNDVAIREEQSTYISRMHATIERTPEGWFIRDGQFGSKRNVPDWHLSLNGTYVNGMEVDGHEAKLLSENDIITIGNTTLKVVIC